MRWPSSPGWRLGLCALAFTFCRDGAPGAHGRAPSSRIATAPSRYPIALGRDEASGLERAIGLAWTSSCTDPRPYERVFFPEVESAVECSCVGGEWRSGACEPAEPRRAPPEAVILGNDRDGVPTWFAPRPHARRAHFRVKRATRDLLACGIHGGDAVLAVDGVAPAGREPLHALLEGMPEWLPGRLTLDQPGDDSTRELYFVDHDTMRSLAQRMPALARWNAQAHCRSSRNCYELSAYVGSAWYFVRYDPSLAAGLPWAVFAGEMLRAGEAFHAKVAESPDPLVCSELRALPTVVTLTAPAGDRTELRYVVPSTTPRRLYAR